MSARDLRDELVADYPWMRIRWFGEPWPSPMFRASICESDRYRIDAPVGQACAACGELVAAGDRGVVMAWLGPPPEGDAFTFQLDVGGMTRDVLAYHLDCHLESSLGPDYREQFAGYDLPGRRP